jgi:hypothetical protein
MVAVRVTHPLPLGLQLEDLRCRLDALARLASPALVALTRVKELKDNALEIDY